MGTIGIKDVAKLAGVSTATVSRVLSGTDAVAENTRQKVLDAAEQLGYQPNLLGRHLRCRQTNIILIMLSSLADVYKRQGKYGRRKAPAHIPAHTVR